MEPSAHKLHQANSILEDTNLLPFLNQFGRAEVVGSVALDLIVKPDLDIHLLINNQDLMPTAHTIVEYLIEQNKIREVRLTDWRQENGLKIGVDAYPTASGDWSIDIWVTNDQRTTAFDFVETLNNTLTENQRGAILKIKTHFYKQGLLRDGLGLKVYNAVVEHGIETVDEFLKFAASGSQ